MIRGSSVRVLVVDDFRQWRRVVRGVLRGKLGLRTIAEAADGLEAVRKAEDLQPDLVVLDIGLPTLNGIEAARRITGVSPRSKVVFLTENYSCDVAEAALNTGVLEGRQFLSAKLTALTVEPEIA